ncbi:hypothetical protein GGF46_000599, partial [Coemansia sp. RSA 552]
NTEAVCPVSISPLNWVCTGNAVVVGLLTGSTEQVLESKGVKTGDGGNVDGEDVTEDIEEARAAEQIDVGEETPVGAVSIPPEPGEVVGVIERKWRPYVATLQVDEAGGMRHLAVPVDASILKIRIHYLDVAAIKDRYCQSTFIIVRAGSFLLGLPGHVAVLVVIPNSLQIVS